MTSLAGHRTHRRDWKPLALSIVAVAVVAVLGSLATDTAPGSWYRSIEQPAWNPPDAVFGPVWTVLYLAMAVAAWLVATDGRHPRALLAYGIQLVLNVAWTLVFFGLESPVGGLVVIVALAIAIGVTIARFRPIDERAAGLLVPYLAWVVFAATINAGVVVLN